MQHETHPRLRLSQWPTPIEQLDRLSAVFGGPRISMKRDDLAASLWAATNCESSNISWVTRRQRDAMLSQHPEPLQSNHARLTAGVAAKLGLECHLVLIDEVPDRSEAYYGSANRLIDDLVGAHVELVERNASLADKVARYAERLQAEGKSPYVIPVGGSNAIGCLGYVACAFEIAEQERTLGTRFTHIFVVSGSGGTHAGLLVGLNLLGSKAELLGATISRSAALQRPIIEGLVDSVSPLAGAEAASAKAAIELDDSMYLPGYGLPNASSREAIVTCAKSEGILLDPVYTSKAMAALYHQIKAKRFRPSDEVLFIHTGGAPALFAYNEIFKQGAL
jgi:1-aminocyclopropane-1-carboxylate deaminase/D-cysteine desulfhydrase-like pyridoxal-dependent ACC family enzyme